MYRAANLKTSLIMTVFLMVMACTAAGEVIYVDDDAYLGGNGQNWATPYRYLQDALTAAVSGDEIRVAEGIYKPDRGGGNAPGNREATFQLKNGVVITGGYAGLGEPNPNARDIEVYETILSGDIRIVGNNSDNSFHIVTGSYTDSTAVLDGFTVTGGNVDIEMGQEIPFGAGMFALDGSATLANCTFTGNSAYAGGGVCYLAEETEVSPTLTNCTFTGNSAEIGGGLVGAANTETAAVTLTITNGTFTGNSATSNFAEIGMGGALYHAWGTLTLNNCIFTDNSAEIGGALIGGQCNSTLTNCTFTGNSATGDGDSEIVMGGAFYNESGSATIINCIFSENSCSQYGGAISEALSSSSLYNCLFTGNSCSLDGGAMYYWYESRPNLYNCTFAGNSAPNGNAIASTTPEGTGDIPPSTVRALNCIFWDGGSEIFNNNNSFIAITYSDVQGGWPGIGNINADPLFMDPAIGDYHLLPGSPCIDTGDNSAVPSAVVTDLDGNYRIANGTVDMGVYEFGSTPPQSTLFVDARATGVSNGSSWVDAFTDVQEALTVATAFPQVEEIRVAQGAYSPEGPLPDIRRPTNPNPADGAIQVNIIADLSWTAGPDAASHDVYFGATSPPPFMQNQAATTFDPGTMAYSTTYYWRIDEVGPSRIITGAIWSFSTLSAPPPMGSNESLVSTVTVLDREATFQLKNGVVIKGGYAGFGEPNADARDIDAYETFLSGDIGILGDNSDNSYHVVTGSGTDATAVLDGFTITAGFANGGGNNDNGGGMHNTQSSPTVTNCTFTKNTAHYAGAMSNQDGSNPIVTDCTFIDNYAPGGGGGAIFYWHSGGSLTNCSFRNNSGRHGGAARIYASNVTITNCLFADNYSSGGEGGGAIYLQHCTTFFKLCTLSRNATDGSGGGIFNRDDSSNFTLQNCVLWNNNDSGGMDESAQVHSVATMATIDYCCIQGWTGNFGGTGNIDADPCFVETEYVGPISYWKFDEAGGTTAYDSVGQNHGTVYGAQWTSGQLGSALDFDGMNDYVDMADTVKNYLDTSYTVSAWINTKTIHGIHYIAMYRRSTLDIGYQILFHLDHIDSDVRFIVGSLGNNAIASHPDAITTNTWYHIAGVREENVLNVYVNGVSGMQDSEAFGAISPDNFKIGAIHCCDQGIQRFFDGTIDDVAIYNRALSADEIQQHYQNGLSGQGNPDAAMPDYHLLFNSPCINTGDPDYIAEPNEIDLDGKPRVIAGRIDMGAYEYFNTRPVADAGPDRTVEAHAPWGATVTLDASGSSDADSTPGTIDDINDFNWYQLDPCDPNADVFLGSGRIIDCNLSIGEHIILIEVIDKAGAYDSNEVTIIVQDTTPPDINCPPDVTLECPADTTPSATGKATATDTCGAVTITHSDLWQPSCGNAGTLARTWTATDESGNTSNCVQIITVVDTTPPAITCPADVTLQCPADTSVEANGSASAVDTCGTVTITHSDQWQPGCGNTGILTRTWMATDNCGNSSSCLQTLTVVDTTPPDFELSVSPTMLWPPDHKMVKITPNWMVSDDCDASPDVSLVGIVANEGDNTIGDGHTSNDIQIGEDGSIYLRSERSGTSSDRIYTITYQAVDDCGNTTLRSAAVSIPHDFKVLARIASRWLWAGPGRIPEDLNGDGFVNLADFAKFAGNWTR